MNTQTSNLVIAFIATFILGLFIMPILRRFKVGQIVRDDGPKEHLKKQGTPTMGGVVLLIVLTIILALNSIKYPMLLLSIVAILGFGMVGFIDDYKKLVKRNTKGLSPIKKIIGLVVVTVIFITLYLNVFDLSQDIIVPFVSNPVILSPSAFVLFIAFILIGTSNAVNLTDGLDGLAAGVVAIIMTFFTVIAVKNSNTEMIILGAARVGTCLAFLLFNFHPAKVFMGDTGSLALGGAVASIAIIMKMPLYLAIVALVCIIDTMSVILQVLFFKITKGKILFKMAPFHHHLELSGMRETSVVILFWSLTTILCLVAYLI